MVMRIRSGPRQESTTAVSGRSVVLARRGCPTAPSASTTR